MKRNAGTKQTFLAEIIDTWGITVLRTPGMAEELFSQFKEALDHHLEPYLAIGNGLRLI
jgi:hypothetical protein